MISLFFSLLFGYVQFVPAMKVPSKQEAMTKMFLIKACTEGNLNFVKHLIEKGGANVNAENDCKLTPLHFACDRGHDEMVKYLLEKGANANVQDMIGSAPLHMACKQGDEKLSIVKHLLEKGANVNIEGYCKWTPLHTACELGFYKIAKYLVDQGANIHTQDTDNITPLQATCVGTDPNPLIIEYLLEKGANIDFEGSCQNTILHTACEKGFYKVVAYLIERGAYINVRNYYGATPLFFAANCGHLNTLKLLIQNNADVNAKTIQAATILHGAVYGGKEEVIQYLLKTFPKLIDGEMVHGLTALDLAYEKNNETIIKFFRQHGVRTTSEKEAEANMRAFFIELDEEARQKQEKHEQKNQKKLNNKNNGQNQKLANQNAKKITNTPTAKVNQEIKPVANDLPSCIISVEPTGSNIIVIDVLENVVVKSDEMSIKSGANKPINTCSLVSSINNSVESKKSIIITQKKDQNIAQPIPVTNAYQIGHDIKLKWPRSLTGAHHDLMREHLRQLKNWPQPTGLDIKSLKGQSGMYRLRVGGYRVLFTVDQDLHRIIICEIGLRKKVYRGLQY